MTTNEVAAMLNMQPRTVQRQAHAGQLPTVGKLPGRTGAFLFDRDAIEQIARGIGQGVAA